EGWSKVLQLTCLKHGAESAEWDAAMAVMDDLIWSVEPHESAEDRLRLLELVPSLLKSLRDGLSSAAIDPFVTSEFFSQLEAVHVQAFQRFKRETVVPQVVPAESEAGEEVAAEGSLELGEVSLLDLPSLEAEAEVDVPTMVEVVEEIVLLAPGESRE